MGGNFYSPNVLLKFLVDAINYHLKDLRFTMYKVQFESLATYVARISKIIQSLLIRALKARAVGAAMALLFM